MEVHLLRRELELIIDAHLPDTLKESWLAERMPRMTPNEELRLRSAVRGESQLEILAIISRLCPELPSWLIAEYVRVQRMPNLKVNILAALEMPKERVLEYTARALSNRDFYGNFLPLVERILKSLRLTLWKPARARTRVRRRGHRDNTSRRTDTNWLPDRGDVFDKEQELIDEKRLHEEMLLFFFRGLSPGGS